MEFEFDVKCKSMVRLVPPDHSDRFLLQLQQQVSRDTNKSLLCSIEKMCIKSYIPEIGKFPTIFDFVL